MFARLGDDGAGRAVEVLFPERRSIAFAWLWVCLRPRPALRLAAWTGARHVAPQPFRAQFVMLVLILGLVLFLGVHTVSIVAPGWRAAQVARRGDLSWKGLYSAVSAIGLVLLVVGYGMARREPVVLYSPPAGLRHIALLLMVPVFPLLFAAYLPGRIRRITKHPMLLAVKLWATAHLIANGTLVDVVLFGSFLAWAVADRISLKRRSLPEAHEPAVLGGSKYNDAAAVVGGLAAYVLFLVWAHRWLIGVSPLA